MDFARRSLFWIACLFVAPDVGATTFSTTNTSDFLLVGRVDSGVAEAVNVGSSNSLGRLFTVPSPSDPDVDDDPPWPLPADAIAPVEGQTDDGNVAITDMDGSYAFSDIDVYADIGIRCVQNVLGSCRDTWSNSNLLSGGTFDDDAGLMAAIETELVDAAAAISALSHTDGWTVSGDGVKNGAGRWELSDGVVDDDTYIDLAAGLNVIEIDTNMNDFSLNNAGLVVRGGADSQVIFLLEDPSQNFLFTNASVTLGTGGIGTDAILFAMLDGGNDTNFGFSKVIVNGVAFWDLSLDDGEISMDNVQGCTQLVGDKVGLQDVQLSRCAFAGVPEPSALPLLAAGGLGLAVLTLRRRPRG